MENEKIELSCFDGCQFPAWWRYKGENHSRVTDENENVIITTYGLVFEDVRKAITVRVCYIIASERMVIVERNAAGKYKTVCNFRADMKENLNEFIKENYK